MTPTIHHDTLEANGTRLHYARTGEGPPIVLLHGWPEFWLTWEPVMARLADRFELIAPDLRGFGDSPKPDEGPSDRAGPGRRCMRRTCWRSWTIWRWAGSASSAMMWARTWRSPSRTRTRSA